MKKAKYFSRVVGRVVVLSLVIAGLGVVGVKDAKIVQAQTYTVRAEHPRMWVTTDTLADLRMRKDLPGVKEHYDALVSYINSRVSSNFYDHSDVAWVSSFLYLCTGETAYADKAINSLNFVADNILVSNTTFWNANPDLRYQTTAVIALRIDFAYDWVYDRLSESQKDFFGRAIVKLANIGLSAYRHSDYNNHYFNRLLPPTVYAGLSLYNNGYQNAEAINFLNYAEENIKNHTLKVIEQAGHNGGGWYESASYVIWGVHTPFSLMLETWNSANDVNLFQDVPALGDIIKWMLYTKRPHDNTFCRLADMNEFFDWIWAENMGFTTIGYLHGAMPPLLAKKYNDTYAQWLASNASSMEYYTSGGASGRNVWHIPYVIWYDPSIPATPANNSLLLTKRFEGLGWVVMRTGFESQDDTFAIFNSGPYYNSHQHCDQNSFVIDKRASLAIDSGYYEWTSHRDNYSIRTIAHNTITIYKPGEVLWDQGGPYANDGGQFYHPGDARQYYTESNTGTYRGYPIKYDKGKIIRFESQSGLYNYSMGDATNAYYNGRENNNKVNNFTRQFIFLRPDYFVVFDRVSSKNSSYTKKWLLHSITQPILDGTETIVQGAQGAGISESANSSLVTITNGQGKLFSKTLLPEQRIIRKVGGSGYEFWVDGKNYPIEGTIRKLNEPGAWRIEVEPTTAQTDDIFLHVLYPTDSTTLSMPETNRIDSTTNNMVGTQIAGPAGFRIVMFSKTETKETGGLAENITYNLSGQGQSKHLIVDLKTNTQFTITNTNLDTGQQVSQESKVSSSQGTLYFETMLGSTHQITITAGGQVPVVRGDVNGDGMVNVVDVQLAVNQFLGVIPQTQDADLNGDGVVNVIDVQLLVNIILGG